MTADALASAYQRVDQAYVHARCLVLDHYPEGVPADVELNDFQRFALYRLQAAESELDRLRRENHVATRAAGTYSG